MPRVGFGVFMIKDANQCEQSVSAALAAGYRSIDTAAVYFNETGVGNAIKSSNVNRSEIFLTTKIWVSDYGYERTKMAIDSALKKLQVDYIDLMLLHRPYSDYLGSWKALEDAVNSGKLRAIGVSNFAIPELQEILDIATIKPVVNQIECHPYFQQSEIRSFLQKHEIALTAWYPLAHGSKDLLNEKIFTDLASIYNKSVVQIILRWHVQMNNIAIPKSTNPSHIKSNINIFDFELTEAQMQSISQLDRNKGFDNMPDFLAKIMARLTKIKH